ncbi:ImmA/IrrE family metallo-endopeptidase [Pseudomonas fluorescens]|uniref:ImmA/IrrE family metallo-endopeptidase n=1 Tax=Pseudomonas fluorescens TaxID=294 RepID=UPI0035235680
MKKLGSKEKQRKKKKKAVSIPVPFLEPDFIENTSYRCVRFREDRVSLEDVCSMLEVESGLRVIFSSDVSTALGSIDFSAAVVTIYAAGRSLDVQRLALAHCIGHAVLDHGRYMESGVVYDSHEDIRLKPSTSVNGPSSLEWQARFFASSLLMPRQIFLSYFSHLQEKLGFRNRGYGPIYLDDQHCNRMLYAEIVTEMRVFFEAPKALVAFRINALKLLTDARRPLRVTEEVASGTLHTFFK